MKSILWSSTEGPSLVQNGLPFLKMHGLRNDIIIVDARNQSFSPSPAEVKKICDRRAGVGADELLIVEPPAKSDAEQGVVAFVRIINTDGREVEACGNASRCVAWLLMKEQGLDSVSFRTLGGILKCSLTGEMEVAVNMGRLKTDWHDIPLASEMDSLHLEIGTGPLHDPVGMNIGNPHAVFFVDDIEQVDLETYGLELQCHPLFPEQANIGVAEMVDATTMKLNVWERPGALTTACGSGACAAVGAAHRRELTSERKVRVIMPAGSMEIEINDKYDVTMIGPVEVCFAGYLKGTSC